MRLLLMPTQGFLGDVRFFTRWANALQAVPLAEFYSRGAPDCDYLPGYLYLLGATGLLRTLLVGPGALPESFEPWIKAGPIAADLALGVVTFLLCHRFVGPRRSLVAAALVLFNPGIVFVSSVWGQVDSVGTLLSVASLAAMVHGLPILAAVLAGAAFVVKPHYTLFLVVVAAAYLWSPRFRTPSPRRGPDGPWARRVLAGVVLPGVAFVASVQLLLLPFSVSLWPAPDARWTLLDRLAVAAERFPVASLNAFNLWATPIAGLSVPDDTAGWLSLSYQSWGLTLLLATLTAVLILTRAKADEWPVVLWGCFVAAFAFFVLPTRIHERYLFVALPLLAGAAVLRPWIGLFYLGVSGLYLANVLFAYARFHPAPWNDWLRAIPNLVPAASSLTVLVLLASLAALLAMVAAGRREEGLPEPFPDRRGPLPSGQKPDPSGILRRALERAGRPVSLSPVVLMAVLVALFLSGVLAGRAHRGISAPPGPFPHRAVVLAHQPWQNAGVQVAAGQRVSLLARGRWTHGHTAESYGPWGSGKADEGSILPAAPIGAVIGRIGDGPPFLIGEGATITGDSAGPLLLAMNDRPDGHEDNHGSVLVSVWPLHP